jgi:hypothetical protein
MDQHNDALDNSAPEKVGWSLVMAFHYPSPNEHVSKVATQSLDEH